MAVDASTDAKVGAVRRLVWDLPVRGGHWALAALMGLCWWSGEAHNIDLHRIAGYAVIGLLVFRIYWGFVGGETSRFGHFVRGPKDVWRYWLSLRQGRPKSSFGHNPMGAWSVVALLGALILLTVTGLFSVDVDGVESGPLSYLVSFDQGRLAAALHHWLFYLSAGLVALHLMAVAFYYVRFRINLVGPMVTGRKAVRPTDEAVVVRASAWRLLIGVVIAFAVVIVLARGLQ